MSAPAQHKRSMGQGYRNSHFSRSLTQWIFFLPIVSVVMVSTQGCSVYLASHQPDKKDLTVLDGEHLVRTSQKNLEPRFGRKPGTKTRLRSTNSSKGTANRSN